MAVQGQSEIAVTRGLQLVIVAVEASARGMRGVATSIRFRGLTTTMRGHVPICPGRLLILLDFAFIRFHNRRRSAFVGTSGDIVRRSGGRR